MSAQYPLALPHREAMGVDDYLVTESNQAAMAWIDQWPAWPAPSLVIFGPASSGKTHLGQIWAARSKAQPLTLERIRAEKPGDFVRDGSAWWFDNAHAVAGRRDAEEALFHVYNHLREKNGTLLLTARMPVSQWPLQLADLRSRLMASPAVALAELDNALVTGLLIKQFRDRQIDVSMDVITYLVPRVTRTPDALHRLVAGLDQAALARNRPITIALARIFMDSDRALADDQSEA